MPKLPKLPKLAAARTWFEVKELATRHVRLHWSIDGKGQLVVTSER